MSKIYIKTPLFKNSVFAAHILEHCIFSQNMDLINYFDFLIDMKGETKNGYTLYEGIDLGYIDSFIDLLKIIPDQASIKYETEIMRQELEDLDEVLLLEEKVGKMLYGKKINLNKVSRLSYKEILKYHSKYYQNPSIVITDDEYNILDNINLHYGSYKGKTKLNSKKINIKYNGEYLTVISFKLSNPYDLYFAEFCMELLYNHNQYYQEFILVNLDYEDVYQLFYSSHIAINVPSNINLDISDDFFKKQKVIFVNDCINNDLKGLKLESIMCTGSYLLPQDIKIFFEDLDYSNIQSVLSGINLN